MSQFIQKTLWIIPVIQILHILAIAAIIGSVLVINTRLLKFRTPAIDSLQFANRLLPVIWWAIPVLLATGTVMIIAEPGRSLTSSAWRCCIRSSSARRFTVRRSDPWPCQEAC